MEAFESIREDLGNSYTVTYYPQPNPNEGFRKITVELPPDIGEEISRAVPAWISPPRRILGSRDHPMAWKRVSRSQHWSVDQDQLMAFLLRYETVTRMSAFKTVVKTPSPTLIPIGWFAPNTKHIEIDFVKLRKAASGYANARYALFWDLISRDCAAAFQRLVGLHGIMVEKYHVILQDQSAVANHNVTELNGYLAGVKEWRDWIQFSRDRCFDAVVVAGGLLTGGAGWIALGGGSILQASAVYEDTGNATDAAITGLGNFAVAAIPIAPETAIARKLFGPAMNASGLAALKKGNQKIVLLMVSASVQGAANVVVSFRTDQDVLPAIEKGLQGFTSTLAAAGFGKMMERIPFPVLAKIKWRLIKEVIADKGAEKAVDEMGKIELPPDPLRNNSAADQYLTVPSHSGSDFISQFVLRPISTGR